MERCSPVTTVESSDPSQPLDSGPVILGDAAQLPDHPAMASPDFIWGSLDSAAFSQALDAAYREVAHWRKNCFDVPRGLMGKQFVSELARLFRAVGEGSALESVALQAIFVACVLLLQKPSRTSKPKDHTSHLQRRLQLWHKGDLGELLKECRAIQSRLPRDFTPTSDAKLARSFANLMFEGKTSAATKLLTGHQRGGLLRPTDIADPSNPAVLVRDVLRDKHPPAQPLRRDCLVTADSEPTPFHPVLFEALNGSLIRSAALRTFGAPGPSGVDARGWRRLCTSFHSASSDLCDAMALFARRLCTKFVSPDILTSFLSCRLIALDKCPGVRPIGVCEVARRIIAKAALSILRDDIQKAAGSYQLCAGQVAGVEAAVHRVRSAFLHEDTDAILLADASNAFNSLNRAVALHNIQQICPSFAPLLINTYRSAAGLFIAGDVLFSEEGTTQGDPLAMPMYALATLPLIKRISGGVTQVWYADDACACGSISQLRNWWERLRREGPGFGYNVNSTKSWLVTKPSCYDVALSLFSDSGVNVTCEGRPYLGAAIGTPEFSRKFIDELVKKWSSEVALLARIAESQPHAAFAALTHGLSSRWRYIFRTMPDISDPLQPLEDVIRCTLLPALLKISPPNDVTRRLLALPPRWGGLGIFVPTVQCELEYTASLDITGPLSSCIGLGKPFDYFDVRSAQYSKKSAVHLSRQSLHSTSSSALRSELDGTLQIALDHATIKGASTWLSALPLSEHGFALHKAAFHDAMALRYGWPLCRTPVHCACGTVFSVDHALSCPKGGLPSLRHNEIRDLTANLLTEVCHQVQVEPELQAVSDPGAFSRATANIQEGARLDIVMNGFWGGRTERCFVDVRVFNPYAPSNAGSTTTAYRRHENIKRRAYGQRVREVEHASFTPIVLSATGGLAPEATTFYRRLASLLASKWGDEYCVVMGWLRCSLCFSLLRSAIACVRGARSSIGHVYRAPPSLDLIQVESNLVTTINDV